MFRSVIPNWAQPFVADIKNVRPDDNCGFRSIVVGLGIHEKHWRDIRRQCRTSWKRTKGGGGRCSPKRMTDCTAAFIPAFRTPTQSNRRRRVVSSAYPVTGYVAAQTYACVLVNLAGNQTETYFPLRIGPDLVPDPLVIGIANWGGDHWIYIKLVGDFPMPTPNPNWARSALPAALEWKTWFGQRLKEYIEIRQGWQREASNVDLDSL
ncbi:uncharacterized protein LOC143559843 [Bidens hawaiensis]|uniref:uncharacterized protein LOC143559843 n=1 Tax=Bidens hawaiensis TaxID=980011 RepID=UPI0040494337